MEYRLYKVYKHTLPSAISDKENDMVYIGITCKQNVKQRWLNGKGYKSNLHFTRAIQKYGWDNFKHEILFEGLTKEEAEQKEIELISLYDSANPLKGYNIDLGGNSVGKHTQITKDIISKKNKGKKRSDEFKKRLSEAHTGKQVNKETRKKISEYHSIKVICIETGIEYSSALVAGRELNIDNSTISKCCKGINKLAGGYHWIYADDYNEDNIKDILKKSENKQHRKVICLETNKIYNSIAEASRDTNIANSNINMCCNGKIQSAGSLEDGTRLHWEYYKEVS